MNNAKHDKTNTTVKANELCADLILMKIYNIKSCNTLFANIWQPIYCLFQQQVHWLEEFQYNTLLIIKQQVETAELISYTDIHCCRGINTSSLSPTTIYSQARSWSSQYTCFKWASTYKLRERNTLVMIPERLQITCSSEKHNFSLTYKSTGVKHTQKKIWHQERLSY